MLDCVLASFDDDSRRLFVQVRRGATTVLARAVQDAAEGTRVAEYLRIELAGCPEENGSPTSLKRAADVGDVHVGPGLG